MEVDRFQDLIRSIQFQEEHDEDPMVGNLLEIGGSYVMIYQQNSGNKSENLVEEIDLNNVIRIDVLTK